MDQFVDLLKQVNIAQVFIIFVGIWFFYARLDKKLENAERKIDTKLEAFDRKFETKFEKLESRFERLEIKFDKLNEKVEDIDRRLCRIEGSLATHGHCLFNQSQPDRKAE